MNIKKTILLISNYKKLLEGDLIHKGKHAPLFFLLFFVYLFLGGGEGDGMVINCCDSF